MLLLHLLYLSKMTSVIEEFVHLSIPLEDIKAATNNFDDTNCIGAGRFGKVYRGEFRMWQGLIMIAAKRLDRIFVNVDPELLKEIMLLSGYKHVNLVSLLGYCDENDEKILVYEYLSNKSLDLYLSSTDLSWNQRICICINAARGLQYLHDPPERTHRRVLHRDIKSSNILLDQNWNAKISDVGLSRIGPMNQQYTFIFSNVVGNMGYCDPLYMETGLFTKQSDVYSFGVVLFEVLCGRHALQSDQDNTRSLATLARICYEENTLDTIIFNSIKEQISPECLEIFSRVAYQCLRRDREERPSMDKVVEELEIALQYQEIHEREKEIDEDSDSDEGDFWETKLPQDWKLIITNFNIPRAVYTIRRELFYLLHKGILFDEGNKFLWINNDGKKGVWISARRFLELHEGNDHRWVVQRGSLRFPIVAEYLYGDQHKIRCQIKTNMLSVETIYAASLVFKYSKKPKEDLKHLKLITVEWNMEGLSVYSTHNAELIQDNWYKIRMWNFFNHRAAANFDFVIEELSYYVDPIESSLLIQGIEFQPVEMVQHEETKNMRISDKEDIDDDLYWEKKLPSNYQDYIQMSDKQLRYTSKKELYKLLCEGFVANGGKMCFSLCKSTGGICTILPATHILCKDNSYESLETVSLSKSRFGEGKELGNDDWYLFTCRLRPFMFSPLYVYACYLVFKFQDNHILSHEARFFKAKYKLGELIQGKVFAQMNLTPPISIPTIKPDSLSDRVELVKMTKVHIENIGCSRIKERGDGWMEVRLCKPIDQLENHKSLVVKFSRSEGGSFSGIIVEGIKFRPIEDVS